MAPARRRGGTHHHPEQTHPPLAKVQLRQAFLRQIAVDRVYHPLRHGASSSRPCPSSSGAAVLLQERPDLPVGEERAHDAVERRRTPVIGAPLAPPPGVPHRPPPRRRHFPPSLRRRRRRRERQDALRSRMPAERAVPEHPQPAVAVQGKEIARLDGRAVAGRDDPVPVRLADRIPLASSSSPPPPSRRRRRLRRRASPGGRSRVRRRRRRRLRRGRRRGSATAAAVRRGGKEEGGGGAAHRPGREEGGDGGGGGDDRSMRGCYFFQVGAAAMYRDEVVRSSIVYCGCDSQQIIRG